MHMWLDYLYTKLKMSKQNREPTFTRLRMYSIEQADDEIYVDFFVVEAVMVACQEISVFSRQHRRLLYQQ